MKTEIITNRTDAINRVYTTTTTTAAPAPPAVQTPKLGVSTAVVVMLACILLAFVPVSAFAANETVDITGKQTAAINTQITAAINAATSGDVVTIIGNATSVAIDIVISAGITLDWNASVSGNSNLRMDGAGAVRILGGKIENTVGNHAVILLPSSTLSIDMSGGVVRSTAMTAIFGMGNNAITVSDGTVSADASYSAITSDGNILISGTAEVFTGAADNYAVSGGNVTVTGGTIRSAGKKVIQADNSITISGGFVFARNRHISSMVVTAGTRSITGDACVIGWDQSWGRTDYLGGTASHIVREPATATAVWGTSGAEHGISYASGANTGFFALPEVTVAPAGSDNTRPS